MKIRNFEFKARVDDRYTLEELRGQCDKYQKYFGLDDSHMVNGSYGDMVL